MQGQTFFTIFPEAQRESSVLKIRKQKYKIIRLSKQHTRAQQERAGGERTGTGTGARLCRGPPPSPQPHPTLCLQERPCTRPLGLWPHYWNLKYPGSLSTPRPLPASPAGLLRRTALNALAILPQEADRWYHCYSSHLNWLTHYFQTLDIHTNPVPPRKIFFKKYVENEQLLNKNKA